MVNKEQQKLEFKLTCCKVIAKGSFKIHQEKYKYTFCVTKTWIDSAKIQGKEKSKVLQLKPEVATSIKWSLLHSSMYLSPLLSSNCGLIPWKV